MFSFLSTKFENKDLTKSYNYEKYIKLNLIHINVNNYNKNFSIMLPDYINDSVKIQNFKIETFYNELISDKSSSDKSDNNSTWINYSESLDSFKSYDDLLSHIKNEINKSLQIFNNDNSNKLKNTNFGIIFSFYNDYITYSANIEEIIAELSHPQHKDTKLRLIFSS